MATTVTVSSNYAGKVAGEIIGASFAEADTIANSLVTVLQDVNFEISLRRIRFTDGTVDYSCGFTPSGAVVLNERKITPVKLMLNLEFCKEDFRQTWSEDGFGSSAHNNTFAPDIESAILAKVLESTAQRTDNLIWNGDSANTGEWDGFTKLFTADAAVIKPTAAGAITSANVLAAFDLVTAAIPRALRRKPVKFIISPDVADAYTKLLIQNGAANGLGGNANTGLVYGRYAIEVVNGLDDNTIVIYEAKNLAFATGLLGDHNEIRVQDMDEVLMDGQVRVKMVYNGGVNYYNSEDIVYYVGA
jgi:hypothetical protein